MKNFQKKIKKTLDRIRYIVYNAKCVTEMTTKQNSRRAVKLNIGVWLSLARAPGLGPGGRRFESCHPEFAGVVQW